MPRFSNRCERFLRTNVAVHFRRRDNRPARWGGCAGALVLATILLACHGNGGAARIVNGSDLGPSDHAEVMQLIRNIFESVLSGQIVAWYETEARGYFDGGKGFVRFEHPMNTLSVAIPEYVSATRQIQPALEGFAASASYHGWRLHKFRIQVDTHGAGGGPAGNFDKVTIYPLEVARSR
jgi:hypothetical protein